ncbi:peptide methionine sulfoxide reductase MsrA [Marivirga lumbricoides]|uniref:peptide-methionine (S)-S-oxide reductase n=1 Tax=Marivirga lumbricoides TaxID=1046115 RepID=A0ABQ1M4L1_9BACT|nr:peptide methionine sulfoxide reductase MsrA [Marivirga lumbricoides]
MDKIIKIGFGGGCHWCTEAIFQSLKGVLEVKQGWINSDAPNNNFSEAVIVRFNKKVITQRMLVSIHLHTHSCTSAHAMRNKYRSAVYTFSEEQRKKVTTDLTQLQNDFVNPIITEAIPFRNFKLNKQTFLNYYYKNPEKPFCQTYITPKLRILMNKYRNVVKEV